MSDAVTATGPRVPRWMKVLLIGSLAANLLLIGLFVGAAVFRHRWGGPAVASGNPLGFVRTLPRERRDEIRRAGRERLQEIRPLWQATGEARRAADRVLTSEPFDVNAFLAAQQRVIDAETSARRAGARLLAETAARLTAEERKAMVQWRDRHSRRWRGRDRDGDAGEPVPPGPPPR